MEDKYLGWTVETFFAKTRSCTISILLPKTIILGHNKIIHSILHRFYFSCHHQRRVWIKEQPSQLLDPSVRIMQGFGCLIVYLNRFNRFPSCKWSIHYRLSMCIYQNCTPVLNDNLTPYFVIAWNHFTLQILRYRISRVRRDSRSCTMRSNDWVNDFRHSVVL